MQVLVFGAGAIGSVLGGMLAKAGHDVTLLGRSWHIETIRRKGLAIRGIWGDYLVKDLAAVTDARSLKPSKPYDWIFVCVKTYQTTEAARAIAPLCGPKTHICAFQNGIGNYELICAHLAPERVALGRVIFGAEIKPGCVRVTVCADDLLIGAPEKSFPRDTIAGLSATLQAAGIPSRATATIMGALWAKVLYNSALNGLSTLLEVPYGKLLRSDSARGLMRSVIEEAYEIAKAHRIELQPKTAAAYIDLLFGRLIPDTAAHHPSMLQDIERGKRTEIEALNGALVRLAREEGINARSNELVTRLVHLKERFSGVGLSR